ncbi:MAG: hypothetical protein CL489_08715 [Acidobacteria bacterium]|nr:hypothetical protein [Acidobacteriota bacterium]|tara:strand:- start:28656 stop:29300 length:645 start_codon:yes stop_codon:yes gene_type:complete
MRREKRFKPVLRIDKKLKHRIKRKKSRDKRDIEFDLPDWYVALLYRCTHCFYTGEKFEKKGDNRMSLERVDNDKGYIVGNVIPVCTRVNLLKNDLDDRGLVDAIEDREEKIDEYKRQSDSLIKLINKTNDRMSDYLYDWDCKQLNKVNINNLNQWHKNLNHYIDKIVILQKDIELLEMALTAESYYRKMSKNAVMLCLMYQQEFNPKERFGVSI